MRASLHRVSASFAGRCRLTPRPVDGGKPRTGGVVGGCPGLKAAGVLDTVETKALETELKPPRRELWGLSRTRGTYPGCS